MNGETNAPQAPENPEPGYMQPIREGVRRIVGEGLSRLSTAADLDELMDQVYAFSEGVYRDLKARHPVERTIDCAAGCSFCCSNHEVHLSPPEALRIASYLTNGEGCERLDDARQRALDVVAAKDASAQHTEPGAGRTLFPCPLLDTETGLCGIYAVRPLVCRGQNSVDKTVCETRLNGATEEGTQIIGWYHQRAGVQAVLMGVRLAMIDAGHEDQVLDLSRSLAVLLNGDDTIERALYDNEVLEPARARTVR